MWIKRLERPLNEGTDLLEVGASQGAWDIERRCHGAAAMNNSGAEEIRKFFVGGLDWSTIQETPRSYFSQNGRLWTV